MLFINVGPPVSEITSQNDFNEAKDKSEIFFLYAGEEKGPLWDNYLKVECNDKSNWDIKKKFSFNFL